MTAPTTITAEVLTRSKIVVPVDVVGKTSTRELVEAVVAKVNKDDTEIQAVRLLLPTAIKGAIDIKAYNSVGRSLDKRKYLVNPMPDGSSASLTVSQDAGVTWRCAGVMADTALAQAVGKLWSDGALEIEFAGK